MRPSADLLPGSRPIDVVRLIEIDLIGLQPAQACLARATDVVGREMAIIGSDVHRLVQLGRS